MKLDQIPVVGAGLAAAILAAGGVTAMTYSASSPFRDGRPAFAEASPVALSTRSLARTEDHRHRGGHPGRHHRSEGRHHPGVEPGDDHGSGGHGADD